MTAARKHTHKSMPHRKVNANQRSSATSPSFAHLSTCITPRPADSSSSGASPTGVADISRAARTMCGVAVLPSALSALSSNAMPPQAAGEAMEVPFMSCNEMFDEKFKSTWKYTYE